MEGERIAQFEDHWGWNGELTSVPGFGFFPQKVNDELDAMTKVLSYVLLNYKLTFFRRFSSRCVMCSVVTVRIS